MESDDWTQQRRDALYRRIEDEIDDSACVATPPRPGVFARLRALFAAEMVRLFGKAKR